MQSIQFQVLILIATTTISYAISWYPDNWARGCDFNGNDIRSVQVGSERCGPSCVQDGECTHFTWNRGTCWLKRGPVNRNQATALGDQSIICGTVPKSLPRPNADTSYRGSSDICAITIQSQQRGNAKLNMNFMAERGDNWNLEKLDGDQDRTTERVDGGKLKLLQLYPQGHFCLQYIFISCGSIVNTRGTERSLLLYSETIKKAWYRKGWSDASVWNGALKVDVNNNCVYLSEYRSNYLVYAIDVRPEAFTECNFDDADCVSRFIEVFKTNPVPDLG